MTAYYNENDPYAAQWLRNLIDAGHIAPGVVDERSIADVQPDDLDGFTQCHFFAGIGGWSHALRLAGWPDDRPVWTGSCPCQPFSVAGRGAGVDDERHLWPAWQRLIAQCRPKIVFGEQVDAAVRHGGLDLVQSDLEAQGYAFAPVGLPAACVGAPHIRQRLWFVANSVGQGLERHARDGDDSSEPGRLGAQPAGSTGTCGRVGALAHPDNGGRGCETEPTCDGGPDASGPTDRVGGRGCASGSLADPSGFGREWGKNPRQPSAENTAKWCEGMPNAECRSNAGALADALDRTEHGGEPRATVRLNAESAGTLRAEPGPGTLDGFWATADWVFCRDGKWRPVEPGAQPLAHGVPARVGRLRAYGNAIVPQVAAEVVRAVMGETT